MTTNPPISREAVTHRAAKHGIPVDTVVELLESIGITVEDPKPKPGIYLDCDGHPSIVNENGMLTYIEPSGYVGKYEVDSSSDLTPARVVPAEPVELTEEDYEALWKAAPQYLLRAVTGPLSWRDIRSSERFAFRDGVSAALAKYAR